LLRNVKNGNPAVFSNNRFSSNIYPINAKTTARVVLTFIAHTSGLTRYILYLALRALLRNVKNGNPAVFSNNRFSSNIYPINVKTTARVVLTFIAHTSGFEPETSASGL
jgi:hypothetical protein